MEIIYKPRQTGKTTDLLKWLREGIKPVRLASGEPISEEWYQRVLLVPNYGRRFDLLKANPDLPPETIQVFFDAVRKGGTLRGLSPAVHFAVDDLDLCLGTVITNHIDVISLS